MLFRSRTTKLLENLNNKTNNMDNSINIIHNNLENLSNKTNVIDLIYNEQTGKIYTHRLESTDIVNVFEVVNKTDLTSLSNARLLDLAKVTSENKVYRLMSNNYSNLSDWVEASLVVNQSAPPIGFIYLQIDNTQPQNLWPGTSWVIVSNLSGRYLKFSISQVGQTGGSNTHAHNYEHYHLTSQVANHLVEWTDIEEPGVEFINKYYPIINFYNRSVSSGTATSRMRTSVARYNYADKNTTDAASSEPAFYTIVAWRRTA